MDAIKTQNLYKKYNGKNVVDDLTISVPQNSIYGFIGKNGAGKSTTLKMLSGLVNPSGGEIYLFGESIDNELVRHRVGVLIESAGIYTTYSAFENMMLKAYCFGVVDAKKTCMDYLELVGLLDEREKKVKQFSMGMKQRLGIAMALVGNPDLLLLDEPTNGLDPEGMMQIRETLLRLNRERGITMLVSSHILGELSKISTHYGIIKKGKLILEASADMIRENCQDYLKIIVNDVRQAAVILEQELKITKYEIYPQCELRVFDKIDTDVINQTLLQRGIKIKELYRHHQDLDDYFIELMGGTENV